MPKLCPTTESIKVIGTMSRLLIIRHLDGDGFSAEGGVGFNQLKKVCKLSSRTLALNLEFLRKREIVSMNKVKNRSYYSLTKRGKELVPILEGIGRWGNKWNIWGKK